MQSPTIFTKTQALLRFSKKLLLLTEFSICRLMTPEEYKLYSRFEQTSPNYIHDITNKSLLIKFVKICLTYYT